MVSHLVSEILIFVYAWVIGSSRNTTHTRIHMWQLGTVFFVCE